MVKDDQRGILSNIVQCRVDDVWSRHRNREPVTPWNHMEPIGLAVRSICWGSMMFHVNAQDATKKDMFATLSATIWSSVPAETWTRVMSLW